jgi:ABC-2 type transport system permease protein
VNAAALGALVERDYRITRSYRLAFVMDFAFGVVEVAVFFFISRSLSGTSATRLSGAPSYFAFAVLGIIVGMVVGSAITGAARRLREEQLTGTLEALAVQPVGTISLALGPALFPTIFALVRASFYIALAVLVFDLNVSKTSWGGLVIVLLLASMAFLTIGIASAALTAVFKRGDTLASLAVLAMGFLGGSVFPISVLPGWLEPIGRIMPTRFAFDGARAAVFGRSWTADAGALVAFAVVGLPLAVFVFGRALDLSRARGSLAQY